MSTSILSLESQRQVDAVARQLRHIGEGAVPRAAGLLGAADTISVASMANQVAAQAAGLGAGHVPLHLTRDPLARGELLVRSTESEREPGERIPIDAAWRADARGRAIDGWLAWLSAAEVRAALAA